MLRCNGPEAAAGLSDGTAGLDDGAARTEDS